jgi:dehydratase
MLSVTSVTPFSLLPVAGYGRHHTAVREAVRRVKKTKKKAIAATAAGVSMSAATALLAFAAPASAVADGVSTSSTVGYVCQSRFDGSWFPINGYSRGFTTTAPSKVSPGAGFNVAFDPAPIVALGEYNKELTDIEVAYKVSPEAQVLGYKLVGGKNLGSAAFHVERRGAEFVVTSPDSIPGGVEFDLPSLVVTLRAPGQGAVATGPGGSSFEKRSFGWNRLHPANNQWDPFQCYADPATPVVFSTTAVG